MHYILYKYTYVIVIGMAYVSNIRIVVSVNATAVLICYYAMK